MILSAFDRKDSPWVWAQFASGPGVKKRYRRLAIRKDDPDRERKVRAALHQLEGVLLSEDAGGGVPGSSANWEWVSDWIFSRWQGSTAKTYAKQWEALREWLEWAHIPGPAMLTREMLFDYLHYRTAQKKFRSGLLITKNTAVGEIKTLAQILEEAVRRGLISANPARRLGVTREETADKAEISADEEKRIRCALRAGPVWMRLSFHVGISTGLRLRETALEARAVRWDDQQISIANPKGGKRRGFSIPLYPSIRPDLEEMRRSGREVLFEFPDVPSVEWRKFFDGLGMPHVSFHCTRVTFITRGLRAGIPENVMMKMVNHGSTLISRIYQRWTHADVMRYASLLAGPSAPAARGRSPRAKRSP